jgi:hypothetical protein
MDEKDLVQKSQIGLHVMSRPAVMLTCDENLRPLPDC